MIDGYATVSDLKASSMLAPSQRRRRLRRRLALESAGENSSVTRPASAERPRLPQHQRQFSDMPASRNLLRLVRTDLQRDRLSDGRHRRL